MYRSIRVFFQSYEDCVQALLLVMQDARSSDKEYEFGSTSAKQIFASGLLLNGDVEEVAGKLEVIEGSEQYDD